MFADLWDLKGFGRRAIQNLKCSESYRSPCSTDPWNRAGA